MKKFKLILLYSLIALGVFFRIWGFLYMGNHNYYSYRDIGQKMTSVGLVEGYGVGYFPIAWYIFGFSHSLGELTQPNWWWPYKFSNFVFEVAILFYLLYLFKKQRFAVTFMYWLNPWFLIPPSWEGFWDAMYVFFILFAAFLLDSKIKEKHKFLLAGLIFTIPATIKPQTFAPLLAMGIYFFVFYIVKRRLIKPVIFFGMSFLLPFLFNLYFFFSGKPFIYFIKWYISNTMLNQENLVNSEINIWYTIVKIILFFQGRNDPVYSLTVYEFPYNLMEYTAGLTYVALIFFFIRKTYLNYKKLPRLFFLKLITFASFLLPQIFTRSHAYHLMPATLLLIPIILIEKDKKLFYIWLFSVAIHFYNIFRNYKLGPDIQLPFDFWQDPFLIFLGFLQFLITIRFITHFFAKEKLR